MDFQKFIDQSWEKHDGQTAGMVKRYELGLQLAKSEEDYLALSRLITHVATDHDFKFEVGLHYLEKIEQNPVLKATPAQQTIKRQVVTLKFISKQEEDISQFSVSDRSIIFITTAATLLYQGDIEKTEKYVQNAVSATISLKPADPAFRFMAINCNNMAAFFNEKKELSEVEKNLMIDLAHYSRNNWGKAGTWLQIERAEYYLSKYYRKILDFQNAKNHAELCLSICNTEKAPALEMYFAHEALANTFKGLGETDNFQMHHKEMKNFFSLCTEADQAWMQESLSKSEQ